MSHDDKLGSSASSEPSGVEEPKSAVVKEAGKPVTGAAAPAAGAAVIASSDPSADALFNFPCDFPIKVMGKAHPDFSDTILDLIATHDPTFDKSRVETRSSGGGNYTGLTVNVTAQSRAHLDGIYLALTGHPMVKIVL